MNADTIPAASSSRSPSASAATVPEALVSSPVSASAHLALARKWRPRNFGSLVGQEHVVRALTHALETQRLHHAYLFTGTRGVGKTTIARILAKALNCEQGMRAQPCGICDACTGIDAGRFVDCIELDAASNRGVDEMTQLLENAVYAPTAGRYKVYVIDEVHMLSTHAFNAMLKTLEEPPPHVVFVLATTDPQRVPVTVLSRCLQFNLKNMSAPAIAAHLATVLDAEGIGYDAAALELVARAATGSMRDALSLLDQAIAFGAGSVHAGDVREMIGAVDADWYERILDALVAGDGRALVAIADAMLADNAPFERALAGLARMLQRIALAQVGAFGDAGESETALLTRFAQAIAAEDLQLWYQIVTHGARELALAPDEHTGFTMVLLRLFAFRPDTTGGHDPQGSRQPRSDRQRTAPGQAQPDGHEPAGTPAMASAAGVPAQPPVVSFDGDWPALAARLPVSGFVRQFMEQSELLALDGGRFRVRVPIRALAEEATVRRVRAALTAHFGTPVRLDVEVGSVEGDTAAGALARARAEAQAQAERSIESDSFVRSMIDEFGGTVVAGSVRPRDPAG